MLSCGFDVRLDSFLGFFQDFEILRLIFGALRDDERKVRRGRRECLMLHAGGCFRHASHEGGATGGKISAVVIRFIRLFVFNVVCLS